MERRPDRFTAVLDANVLAGAMTRDLLLCFAEAGLFRPRWSARILEETRRALLARGLASASAERVLHHMDRAFPEASISSFESYEIAFGALPDKDDRHVVAAAIKCDAAAIVTWNLRDFPRASLDPVGTEAITPDDFLADLTDIDQSLALHVVERMRLAMRKPEMGQARLLERMTEIGLVQTSGILSGAGYGA